MTKIKILLSSSFLLLLLIGCESSEEPASTPNSDVSAARLSSSKTLNGTWNTSNANLTTSEILNGTWNISHLNLTASTAKGFISCSLADDTKHFGTMTFNQTDSTVSIAINISVDQLDSDLDEGIACSLVKKAVKKTDISETLSGTYTNNDLMLEATFPISSGTDVLTLDFTETISSSGDISLTLTDPIHKHVSGFNVTISVARIVLSKKLR